MQTETATANRTLRFSRLSSGRYHTNIDGLDVFITKTDLEWSPWHLTIDDIDEDGNGTEYIEAGEAAFSTKRDAVAYATKWIANR